MGNVVCSLEKHFVIELYPCIVSYLATTKVGRIHHVTKFTKKQIMSCRSLRNIFLMFAV